MRRGFSRPPGPPPLELVVMVSGARLALLRLSREDEPQVCARVEELVGRGAYDGALLEVKSGWIDLRVNTPGVARKTEPRRIRHSKFNAGSVGWGWSTTPSSGDGSLFICRDRQDGLDAAFQEIGFVAEGLEAVLALPICSVARVRGRPLIGPSVLDSIRVRSVDVRPDLAEATMAPQAPAGGG